jgi:hypothetical protein
MTKVKRYSAALTHAETSPMYEASDGEWVVALDFDRVTAERDALQQRLNAADQRIDELERGEKAQLDPPQPITEQFLEDHLGKMPERIKGMIAARGGEYAIMIDENNGHYGWTFRRDPNGTWVSGRKATDAEMQAARQYARHTNQQ